MTEKDFQGEFEEQFAFWKKAKQNPITPFIYPLDLGRIKQLSIRVFDDPNSKPEVLAKAREFADWYAGSVYEAATQIPISYFIFLFRLNLLYIKSITK